MKTFRTFLGLIAVGSLSAGAWAQQPIKIGVLMPTSGVLAALATEQINGINIFFWTIPTR